MKRIKLQEFIPGTLLDPRKKPGDVWQLAISGKWAAIGPLGYRMSYDEKEGGETEARRWARTGKDSEGNDEQQALMRDNDGIVK
jgi:hypothetical protein|tara:strand:+ start:58 stop:309 length:252 start_codon:yes stop_codon:yes gene_type:complete